MAARFPPGLRRALADLITKALDPDPANQADAQTATAAVALLVAYAELAGPSEPLVSVARLLTVARPLAPANVCNLEHGFARLSPDLVVQVSRPSASAASIGLRPPLLPLLAPIRERLRAYGRVLRALSASPRVPGGGREAVLARAALLFNAGLFFEAHEMFESAWRAAEGNAKVLLQGLVQVAVGLHHYADRNYRGARRLLLAGAHKVRTTCAAAPALDLPAFLAGVEPWEHLLATTPDEALSAAAAPPLPSLRWHP